ncbi:Peptidase family M28-like protein 4 [Elsinoe fawcettii]|nr:Peptidase family M28-like protein 4 [Elsinoe fawcettii]
MRNPFAFTPLPVTILTTAIYVAVFTALVVLHHQVPSPPANGIPKDWSSVNVTESWFDLKTLSKSYHPYNSRANLEARSWLLDRIGEILGRVHVVTRQEIRNHDIHGKTLHTSVEYESELAVVLNDLSSNITFPDSRSYVNYFEGDNVAVYIRGKADPAGRFWNDRDIAPQSLTLVNAHYDSVSTGYGATDDGAGVVSMLQLLSHFLSPDKQPEHGIVLLFNDGEEDGLYGAYAYLQHPISKHTRAFLNLEGTGPGGRATLFRSTDAAVTAPYAKSKYPFGTVISADGFKRGLVRSGTDYSVFNEALGMRGLDVAYMEPRSRYHTNQDDTKDTSKGSVWHMLSMALATTTELASKDWNQDDSESGVWFDIFGRVFAVLRMHTLFALCVTLLAVGPVSLAIVEILLKRRGKWYPFSFKTYLHGEDDDEPVKLYGLRGFFRFPIAFVISTAAVVALAYLVTKINPYIIYSSPYVVWSMMLSAHIAISWFLLTLLSAVRPTALSRLYALLWLYIVTWVLLLAAAIASARLDIAGLYFVLIYNLTVLLSLHISYIELFALPSKAQYAAHVAVGASRRPSHDPQPQASSRPTSSRAANETEDPSERTALLSPTSTRPRDRQTFARYNQRRSSHDPSVMTAEEEAEDSRPDLTSSPPYENEQAWSGLMPRWTWIIQTLLILPLNLILVGQIALLLTSALAQTPADGSEVLTIYLFIAGLAILLLLPSYTVLNRFVWQLPTLLFLIAIGTAIYSLLAAPFTREARLKVFFVQRLDLETGRNVVALNGLPEYVEQVVAELPSSSLGNAAVCRDVGVSGPVDEESIPSSPLTVLAKEDLTWAARRGLRTCAWEGISPNPLRHHFNSSSDSTTSTSATNVSEMKEWISFSSSHLNSSSQDVDRFLLTLSGQNTRSCRVYFDPPEGKVIANITVLNACPWLPTTSFSMRKDGGKGKGKNDTSPALDLECAHGRQVEPDATRITDKGNTQIRLWSRTFDPTFRVVVDIAGSREAESNEAGKVGVKGKAMCVWSDANKKGTIPALDELLQYAPVWAAITKNGDGLVEGYKEFEL